MDASPTVVAARTFLSTVWEGEVPTDEALLAALDRLVAVYHETPAGNVTQEVEAPRQDGASLFAELAARYPHYGSYPVADPMNSGDDTLMLGNAIDDLADLSNDMREVTWLAEHDPKRTLRLGRAPQLTQ